MGPSVAGMSATHTSAAAITLYQQVLRRVGTLCESGLAGVLPLGSGELCAPCERSVLCGNCSMDLLRYMHMCSTGRPVWTACVPPFTL